MEKATSTAKSPGGCGGDSCDVIDPWPLFQVRHRGIYCRLCSSCVLKYHPGHFCTLCFSLLDVGSPSSSTVVHCSKCTSVTHLNCLPNPGLASQFVCPSCRNPEGFSYFDGGRSKGIDIESAKVILVAARLAERSMRRAVAVVLGEGEKKVRDSAVARKRMRDSLQRVYIKCKQQEKNDNADVNGGAPKLAAVAVQEPKKKVAKMGPGGVDQKRGQSREIEKWMRCHEPISIVTAGRGKGEKDRLEGGEKVQGKSKGPRFGAGQEEKDKQEFSR